MAVWIDIVSGQMARTSDRARTHEKKRSLMPAVIVILAAAIFLIDLSTPLGWAVWILYVVPLFLHARMSSGRHVVPLAAACTVLTLVGFVYSSPGVPALVAGSNRALGTIVFWLGTFLLIRHQRAEASLRAAHEALDSRVSERTEALARANAALQAEIKERAAAEEALRESQVRFSSAFKHAAIGMAILGIDGRWLQVNQSLCDIVGYSEDELLAITCHAITHPEDLAANQAHLQDLLLDRTRTFQMEKRYTHQRGHHVWVLLSASLVRDVRHAPLYFIAQFQDITTRKRVEEALRESEERFRGMAETVPEIIFTARADGQCDYVNARFYEYTGMPAESASGEGWISALHPADVAPIHAQWTHAHTTGEPFEFRFRLRAATGVYRWFQFRSRLVHEAGGRRIKWFSACNDIDDFVKAQEALRSTEEQFISFMQNLSGFAWIKDIAGAYVYTNQYFRETFGLCDATCHGKTDAEVFPPETAAQFIENDQRVIRTRHAVQAIETFQLNDGLHCGLVTKFPMFDETGILRRVGGISIDITERKRAEEQLRENEQQMRLFMLATNDIIWNWDLETHEVTRSIGFEKVFGYAAQDVAPTVEWWKERVHPDDLPDILSILQDALAHGGTTYAYEYRFRRRDDSYAVISDRAHIMRDRAGRPIRALGAMTDISERKRAEEALRKSDEQLRKMMEEREQLAQDLHDNIIQSVYAIGLGLEECQQLMKENSSAALTKLTRAIGDLNVVIRDVRNYIVGEEPDLIVSAKHFRAELARLVQTMQGVQFPRFRVTLEAIAASQLTPEEARHVLFIAREAMSNSLRHSGAKTGAVSFRRSNGNLRLEVEDDGHGFDVQAHDSDGCGLRNMK
ncbi:MAG: PAS domain S-box protein, partial [Nitrospiraceae bacterium]